MDAKKQHARVARTETTWATEARKDARYNATQARQDFSLGDTILGNMHQQESEWDTQWANRRLRIAATEKRKAR
jgi:hypothetical protein